MPIEFLEAVVKRHDIATRMPFKYGIATMTDVPHVFVSVKIHVNGTESTRHSADHLPPKWFTKDPEAPVEREIADMEAVIMEAIETARGI